MELGNRLVGVMNKKGLSARELSRRSGLSLSCIRKMRRAKYEGSLFAWLSVAEAMNMSLDELVSGEGCDRDE